MKKDRINGTKWEIGLCFKWSFMPDILLYQEPGSVLECGGTDLEEAL